jgi:hypothetical protein
MNKHHHKIRKVAVREWDGLIYWLPLRSGTVQSVPCNCDHLLINCAPHLSTNHTRFIHQRSSPLWLQQTHPVPKPGETGREMAAEFCLSVFLSFLKGSFTCRKMLRHVVDGFNSPPNDVVIWIFIVLKNSLLSAAYEPANLGSNRKHDNHYTKENDWIHLAQGKFKWKTMMNILVP